MTLSGQTKSPNGAIPAPIQEGLSVFINALQQHQGSRLIGAYLFGSLANGCHKGEISDVDVVAVLAQPLDAAAKEEILNLHRQAAVPVDVVYITADALHADACPTWAECVIRPMSYGPQLFTLSNGFVDFLIIRQDVYYNGVRLFGPEVRELVRPVPWEQYRFCLAQSFRLIMERWGKNPVIALCRVLCSLTTRQPCRKEEAMQWALTNLATEWHDLIAATLQEYAAGKPLPRIAKERAQAFEAYCRQLVDQQ